MGHELGFLESWELSTDQPRPKTSKQKQSKDVFKTHLS
jgi:hypothetical protein